jgi:L-ascorbate metabolism protein UlaG (beta-lactamase superfamily)
MRVQWFGQSSFRLEGGGRSVSIDPFGDTASRLAARGLRFDDRTERVNFLEPIDGLLERMPHAHRVDSSAFELGELPDVRLLVVVPAAP